MPSATPEWARGQHFFSSLAAGPHPRRELTLMRRRRRSLAGGAEWPLALIPPAPSGATISYGPRRVPAVIVIVRLIDNQQTTIRNSSFRRECQTSELLEPIHHHVNLVRWRLGLDRLNHEKALAVG